MTEQAPMKLPGTFPGELCRVETGPVQFGDDWPGVFIRGDDAAGYVLTTGYMLAELQKRFPTRDFVLKLMYDELGELHRLLRSCDQSMSQTQSVGVEGRTQTGGPS